MMTVLFLVMEFPPLNAGGVFRPLRFIRGLSEKGIHPVILTFEIDETFRKLHGNYDDHLLQLVPEEATVIRIPIKDISQYTDGKLKRFYYTYFSTSDRFGMAWRDNLFNRLPQIIEKYKPEALYATAPPFSAAGLAEDISKKFNLPLVLDMRDAWAKLSMGPVGSYFHYLAKKKQERKAFKQATSIVTVTPQLGKIFQETHPSIAGTKFNIIFNSSNEELPETLTVKASPLGDKEAYHIGYTGAFYYSPEARKMMLQPWYRKKGHRMLQYTPVKEDWLYRSPYFFFQTLKRLFEKRPEWKSRIFFHHIGESQPWLKEMAADAGLTENVILHGFQPRQKVLELEKGFDLLLGTSEKVMGKDHYCLPSKLFTYMRSGKPVLGLVTPGIQEEFLRKSGLGVIADPDQIENATDTLEQLCLNGYSANLDMQYLKQFGTPQAVTKLWAIMQDVIAGEQQNTAEHNH